MENRLIHGDCFEILPSLPDNSVDAVITDPPYGYLNHKLDCPFDYKAWLNECFRVLKQNGGLIFFGRGVIAARWLVHAEDIGFKFKEELVWYKKANSGPMNSVMRVHELAWLMGKGKFFPNKIFIDKITYDEQTNPQAIVNDCKRILSSLKKIETYDDFVNYQKYDKDSPYKHSVTQRRGLKDLDAGFSTITAHQRGKVLSSLLVVNREHYTFQHPTQKPLTLIKQLVELASNPDAVILDPFCGSGTTAIACLELGRRYICIEKDAEYYEVAKNRISDWHNQAKDRKPDYELPDDVERQVTEGDGQLKLF